MLHFARAFDELKPKMLSTQNKHLSIWNDLKAS